MDLDLANSLIGRFERIVGETPDVDQAWGQVALVQGEIARAIRHLRRVYDDNPSNTIGVNQYAYALSLIGEFETILEIGRPMARIYALQSLGRHDEARVLIEQIDPVIDSDFLFLTAIFGYVDASEYEEAIAYADRHFDGLTALMEHFAVPNGENSNYMAPLAYAYLQVGGEDEFKQITQGMNDAIGQLRTAGSENFNLWFREAELAALTGDDDELLEHLKKIVDNGYVDVLPFESPLLDRLKDNAKLQELRAVALKRANDERAKLGLDPYLPVMASN